MGDSELLFNKIIIYSYEWMKLLNPWGNQF